MRQHKRVTWIWTQTLCSLIHCIIGETQNAAHSERISCLDVLYLEHWGTSLGPGTLAYAFFTYPYYRAIQRGFSQVTFSLLLPISRILLYHRSPPLCWTYTASSEQSIWDTCTPVSATTGSYGDTTVRPRVQNTSFLLEKKCRKSPNRTGHFINGKVNGGISVWPSPSFSVYFHSYFSDRSEF